MDAQFTQRGFIMLRPEWLTDNLYQIQSDFQDTLQSFPDFTFKGRVGCATRWHLDQPWEFPQHDIPSFAAMCNFSHHANHR